MVEALAGVVVVVLVVVLAGVEVAEDIVVSIVNWKSVSFDR